MIVIAVLLTAGFVIVRYRWLLATVRGNSMAPTFTDGQRILVSRVRRFPRRDEVVVFSTAPVAGVAEPGDDPPYRVKRVCAVPEDPLPDWLGNHGNPLVPQGFVVVAGDNPRSQDSRQLGLIDRRDVLGVVSRSVVRKSGRPAARTRR
jgi:signal peptidase I